MSDWLKFILFMLALISFFWLMKAYYIWKSSNWISVVGQIVKVYPKSSQKSVTLNVKYSYAGKEYISDTLDSGSLIPDSSTVVGQLVELKVNPKYPDNCIVRSEPKDIFIRSAIKIATLFSKCLQTKG